MHQNSNSTNIINQFSAAVMVTGNPPTPPLPGGFAHVVTHTGSQVVTSRGIVIAKEYV